MASAFQVTKRESSSQAAGTVPRFLDRLNSAQIHFRMRIDRRTFVISGGAMLLGCTTPKTWNGFSYFTAGTPSGPPLVVAPVGPSGIAQWLVKGSLASFVQRGFNIVGVNWIGMDGGREDYGAQYGHIAEWLAFMKITRPRLYAQSRGGLQLLNFACDNPDAFDRIAALYPVTDPFIFPGNGKPLWKAYGIKPNTFDRRRFTPNLKAKSLRGKRIKIWHGDNDQLVPKDATTDIFAAGCGAEVVTLPGIGHIQYWTPDIADFLA